MKKLKIFFYIMIFILLLAYQPQKITANNNDQYIVYSAKRGLLFLNDHISAANYAEGLPYNFMPIRIFKNGDTLYLTTETNGIFKRKTGDLKWIEINSPLFKRRTILKGVDEYRKISAFCASLKNPKVLYLATKHTIYISRDEGVHWKRLKYKGLNERNYISALLEINGKLVAGTTANGIYIKKGKRFKKISKNLPKEPYSKSLFFYESPSVLKTDYSQKYIYAGFLFGKGIYRKNYRKSRWQELKATTETQRQRGIKSHIIDIADSVDKLFISTNENIFYIDKKDNKIKYPDNDLNALVKNRSNYMIMDLKNGLFFKQTFANSNKKTKDMHKASQRKALYTTFWQLKKNLHKTIKTLKASGHNTLVIDTKDDFGKVLVPIDAEIVKGIQPVANGKQILKIINTLKKNNIYLIARTVVFKDKRLFNAFNNKYAILHSRTKMPWRGNPLEFWVDPFSSFVQEYNIKIAQATVRLGFDEIQFDYIRFPSDGPIFNCYFRYRKDSSTYKSEIMADFLQYAKSRLNVPISVDIYGFNGCYKFGNTIGQDIDVYARFADVVCPMVYPSHFGRLYLKTGDRKRRPYRIIYQSGVRALYLSQYQAIIRPYIQAFNYESPTWGPDYIRFQIEGARESGCDGYTFWNANGEYKMVERAVKEFVVGGK